MRTARLILRHWRDEDGEPFAALNADEEVARHFPHPLSRAESDEVVSFTAAGNERSRAVMRRLGMTHDPADDFDHPALPADSPLRRHVLYRARRTPQPLIGERGSQLPSSP